MLTVRYNHSELAVVEVLSNRYKKSPEPLTSEGVGHWKCNLNS